MQTGKKREKEILAKEEEFPLLIAKLLSSEDFINTSN